MDQTYVSIAELSNDLSARMEDQLSRCLVSHKSVHETITLLDGDI